MDECAWMPDIRNGYSKMQRTTYLLLIRILSTTPGGRLSHSNFCCFSDTELRKLVQLSPVGIAIIGEPLVNVLPQLEL